MRHDSSLWWLSCELFFFFCPASWPQPSRLIEGWGASGYSFYIIVPYHHTKEKGHYGFNVFYLVLHFFFFFCFFKKSPTELKQTTWLAEWGNKDQTLLTLQFAVESIRYGRITINERLGIAVVISDGFDPPWKMQPPKSLSQRKPTSYVEGGSQRRLNQRAEP